MNHNHLPQNPWYPNTQPLPPQPPATTHTMNPWFNSPQAPIVRPPPHTSGINNFIPSNGNFHAQSHLQDQQQQSLLGKRPRDLEDSAGRDDTIASELKGVQTGADGHRYGGAGLGVGYGQGVESEWRQTVRSVSWMGFPFLFPRDSGLTRSIIVSLEKTQERHACSDSLLRYRHDQSKPSTSEL